MERAVGGRGEGDEVVGVAFVEGRVVDEGVWERESTGNGGVEGVLVGVTTGNGAPHEGSLVEGWDCRFCGLFGGLLNVEDKGIGVAGGRVILCGGL